LQEVDAVVERLHSAARSKEGKVEAALSFKQYQELKACTFTPEITRGVPKQTVRGSRPGCGRQHGGINPDAIDSVYVCCNVAQQTRS
jgi:hypothetical protein